MSSRAANVRGEPTDIPSRFELSQTGFIIEGIFSQSSARVKREFWPFGIDLGQGYAAQFRAWSPGQAFAGQTANQFLEQA